MNLDEAIQTLTKIIAEPRYHAICGDVDALKLGIEAMKAIDGIRKHHHLYTASLLPGETKE